MMTKTCKKCETELPIDTGFYANDNTCKECRKARVRKNRAEKIEYYRAYDNARANRPDRVKARQEYARTPEGIAAANAAKQRWGEANKKKRWVSHSVNNAIRDGKLKKLESCENCGKSNCRIEGHHDDYDRPLDVTWLCSFCHTKWHKENGEGANAR